MQMACYDFTSEGFRDAVYRRQGAGWYRVLKGDYDKATVYDRYYITSEESLSTSWL
jgi:hypothetical protein